MTPHVTLIPTAIMIILLNLTTSAETRVTLLCHLVDVMPGLQGTDATVLDRLQMNLVSFGMALKVWNCHLPRTRVHLHCHLLRPQTGRRQSRPHPTWVGQWPTGRTWPTILHWTIIISMTFLLQPSYTVSQLLIRLRLPLQCPMRMLLSSLSEQLQGLLPFLPDSLQCQHFARSQQTSKLQRT